MRIYLCESWKESGLEGELDSWEGAAGAGFLPSEDNAVNDGESGNRGDDPEHRPHTIEEASNNQQDEALGAFHEADLAQGNERLGASTAVADHDEPGRGDRRHHHRGSPPTSGH